MDLEGRDGRTERATGKKRGEERERGNLCMSSEVLACCVLAIGLFGVKLMIPQMFASIFTSMQELFRFERVGDWNGRQMQSWLINGCIGTGRILFPVFCCVLVGTVAGSMVQTRPYFSFGAFRLKWGDLNPVSGLKKLFSIQALANLGISLLKVSLITFVAYRIVVREMDVIFMLPQMTGEMSVVWIGGIISKIAVWVIVLFVGIALLDWVLKFREYEKGIMMTKEEVKDELKQQEVSPVVRRALGKKMRELSMLRMMAAVPMANVVITNPTHVAVALQYEPAKMNAPRVVAKGLRLVAQRIKDLAAQHNIPVMEKPELARAIYKSVKIGHEIPSKFYEAVATVLAYLHKLGRGIKL